jgi:hypothetical protein
VSIVAENKLPDSKQIQKYRFIKVFSGESIRDSKLLLLLGSGEKLLNSCLRAGVRHWGLHTKIHPNRSGLGGPAIGRKVRSTELTFRGKRSLGLAICLRGGTFFLTRAEKGDSKGKVRRDVRIELGPVPQQEDGT